MFTKSVVIKKLKAVGYSHKEAEAIFIEVTQFILNKTVNEFFFHLSVENQTKIKQLSGNNLINFLETNRQKLSSFSKKNFETIFDQTWESYFDTILL